MMTNNGANKCGAESHKVVLFPEILKQLIRYMIEFNALINVSDVLVLYEELLPIGQE